MTKAKTGWAFDAVSRGLMVGHALVVLAIVVGVLLFVPRHILPGLGWKHWDQPLVWWSVAGLHYLLMLVTPLWSWLAARTQTRVSRLWAWLGYFIPLASYWLPAQTLRGLINTARPQNARLRWQILQWIVARDLAGPFAFVVAVMNLSTYNIERPEPFDFSAVYIDMVATGFAANLLSFMVIGGVHRSLTRTETDSAKVFA